MSGLFAESQVRTFFFHPAYVAVGKQGAPGQSTVVTSEQIILTCPVTGVPGANLIYWQRGISVNSSKLVISLDTRLLQTLGTATLN